MDELTGSNISSEKLDKHLRQVERLRILGQLSAAVAHDLKNVIGVVAFSAETLSEKFPLEGEMKEYVNVIHRNADIAARIVKELLDFTKMRENDLAPGSITPVIEESLKLIKTKCLKHNIALEQDLSANLPPVLLEPFELKSALLNLFLNAIEAMPQGGKLFVGTRINKNEKKVELVIQDTGVGISDEDREKMGQLFFTTKPEGSGLGFYMSKQILEFHRARLSFEKNQNGPGVTVMISFPHY